MPITEVLWDKQDVVRCDDRGRATLGSEFAGEQVFIYIARTPDADDVAEMADEKEQVLSKMASWASKNLEDVEWFNLDADRGVVVDKYGEEYETPYSYEPS